MAEAATLLDGGCNPTCWRLQPELVVTGNLAPWSSSRVVRRGVPAGAGQGQGRGSSAGAAPSSGSEGGVHGA